MQDIPEDGQMPAFKTDQAKGAKFAAPTIANLQRHSMTTKESKPLGARSFARTEKHSMRSYMSSLSSMSNFFRVTDSPFGGVIPSSVIRQAMEKRQQQIKREGAQEQDEGKVDDNMQL